MQRQLYFVVVVGSCTLHFLCFTALNRANVLVRQAVVAPSGISHNAGTTPPKSHGLSRTLIPVNEENEIVAQRLKVDDRKVTS